MFTRKILSLVFLLIFFNSLSFSQSDCNNAIPFCGSASLSFPTSTNTTAPAGPNYGKLCAQPSPTWYYMQIGSSGSVGMDINGNGLDIDFAMWGPFNDLNSGCQTVMSGGGLIQSSYDPQSNERLGIGLSGGENYSSCGNPGRTTPPLAQAGEYYIVMLTNFSNSAGNITFNQTSGYGSTNCQITKPCAIDNLTATATCSGSGSGTTISGSLDYFTDINSGQLTISSSCGGSQSYNFTSGQTSSLNYTFTGGAGDGQTCTITAAFDDNTMCNATVTFVEPDCGCSATISPTASTICVGATTQLTINPTPSGGTWLSSDPSVATVDNSGNVTAVAQGQATIIFDDGTCTLTSLITVDASVTPTLANPGPICVGDPLNLPQPSNGITGTWSPAVNNTQTTTYTFTPGAGQCATTETMTVTVNPNTTPTFTNPGPICSGDALTLPTTSTNGVTGTWSPAVNNTQTTTYTFTPSGGCAANANMTVVVDNNVTPTFNNPGPICAGTSFTLPTTSTNGVSGTWDKAPNINATETYTFTPSSGGSCANPTTMQVVVNPLITPTFSIASPICDGDNLTLPTTSDNGVAGTWDKPADNTQTTTYEFTPSGTNCSSKAQVTVVVNPKTTPTFNQIGSICSGGSFTLQNTSNNGVTGTWSPAIDNTQTTTYNFTPDAGQCANPETMTVSVDPQITPTFSLPNQICQGDNLTLPTTSNNGIAGTWDKAPDNTQTTTYTFTPTGATCAVNAVETVNVTTPTTPTFNNPGPVCAGTVFTLPTTSTNGISGTWDQSINVNATTTYTFTPNSGVCANTETMTVVITQKATPSFNNPGPICQGDALTLPTQSLNNFTGTWSPAPDNMNTQTYTFTPGAGECAVNTSMMVTVNQPSTPSFTNPGPVCAGTNFTLPGVSSNGIAGTWNPATPDLDNTQTYQFTPNAGMCAAGASMTVVINSKTTPTFAITDSICEGTNFALPTTSTNGITGTWAPPFNNTIGQNYVFTPAAGVCADQANKTIGIKPRPVVLADYGAVTDICSGDSVHITATSMPEGAYIQWSAINSNTSGAVSGTGGSVNNAVSLSNSGNYGTATYYFTATLNGCTSDTTTVTYTVAPPLNTALSVTSSVSIVEEGETANLNATMNPYVPGVLYSWSPSNTLSCDNCPNPIATPDTATCYYVTLEAPDACPLTDSVCVKYKIKCGDVFVPSIFSPNQDGVNELFKVYGRCLVKMQMTIYDRWGNQVFYSDDLENGWDGTYRGKELNSGTFVYRVHVTTMYEETFELKGNVTLVR